MLPLSSNQVTRIAPSPTGLFHIGTLRTAYINYLAAMSTNGTFILRIDDTDLVRSETRYTDYIYDMMSKYDLRYDVSFLQSAQLFRYQEVSMKIGTLMSDGTYSIEIKDGDDTYQMTILRENGYPTYNFASVVDDYDCKVTTIIRGVDHVSNLPKQQFIWNLIENSEKKAVKFPDVIHLGLLFEGDKKLSKRTNTGDLASYEKYDSRALLNWLLRLGWSHPDPLFDQKHPLVNTDLAIQLFNSGNLSSSNCKINIPKLEWYDKKYKSKNEINN